MIPDKPDIVGGLSPVDDLPQAWKQTVEACSKKANWKFDVNTACPTVEDIIQKVNAADVDKGTKSQVEKYFSRSLNCILVFGSYVAQGASVVFAPAQQIFNVVDGLVGAIQSYQHVFETLATLMERVSVFLERLTIYWKQQTDLKLDKDLRPSVYRVLDDFVQIMAETYRLTDGWRGRGRVMKMVLFGEADDMTKLLARFEFNVAAVTQSTVAIIHRELSESARNLCDVQQEIQAFRQEQSAANKNIQDAVQQSGATLKQVKNELDDKRDSKNLREKLGSVDQLDPAFKAQSESFTDPIDGTEMFQPQALEKWQDVRSTDHEKHSIFGLAGPENYGKSYLCHQIIHQLGNLEMKRSVAWYYVQKEKRTPINKAIKHIIWQLASSDRTFFDHVKDTDLRPGDAENSVTLWQELVMSFSKKKKSSVFFVVIDGIDQFEKGALGELSKILLSIRNSSPEPEGLRVRCLVSGRNSTLDELEHAVPGLLKVDLRSAQTGGLSYPLEQVIETLLERRLEEIFHGKPTGEDHDMRERIKKTLPGVAEGNFETVKRLLADIEQCQFSSDMERVLEQATRTSEERIKSDIDALNEKLRSAEIEQLNVILCWVAAAKVSTDTDPDFLRSVLSLSLKEDDVLRNPVEFIQKRCSSLLSMESGSMTISDDVQKALESASDSKATIPAPEIDLVRSVLQVHFKRTFGDTKIYDRFEFSEFFENKKTAQNQSALVHIPGKAERDIRALKLCLKAVCDLHNSEQHQKLREYASEYLDEHLVDVDLGNVKPAVKQQLGRRLWRVLRDDAVLNAWALDERVWTMSDWFSTNNKFCEKIVLWMQDKEVQTSLQSATTEPNWLHDVSPNGVSKYRALEFVGRHILRLWLNSDVDMTWSHLDWLRLHHHKMTGFPIAVDDFSWIQQDPSPDELQHLEEWAKTQLPIDKPARWNLRVANMYLMANIWFEDPGNELLKTALKRCDQAIEADRTASKAHLMKAQSLFALKSFEQCLATLLPLAVQQGDEGSAGDDESFWTAASQIGECYAELQQVENAEIWYEKVVDHAIKTRVCYGDFADQVSKLLGAFLAQNKHASAFLLLETLDRQFDDSDYDDGQSHGASDASLPDGTKRQSWLLEILGEPCDIHKHLIALAQRSERFGILNEYYQRASQVEHDRKFKFHRIRFNQWRLHWYCGGPDQQESALQGWESLLTTKEDDEFGHWFTLVSSVKELTRAWFRKATEHGFEPASIQEHILRLEEIKKKAGQITEIQSCNVEFAHARLYHLSGDTAKAREMVRPHLRQAILTIEEENGLLEGCKMLARIFAIVDDDVNAEAAWRLMEPRRTKSTTADHDKSAQNEEGDGTVTPNHVGCETSESTSGGQAVAGAENEVSSHEHPSSSPNDEDGSKIDQGTPQQPTNDPATATADTNTQQEASSPTTTLFLKGDGGLQCDGRCGRFWTYADDMHVCKDCLDLQLDSGCFSKLQAGTLDIATCSASHKHFYVPPFDVEAWKSRKPEEMVVGQRAMLRAEWLDAIKSDWHIVFFGQTARGLRTIQKRWIRRIKARRERMAVDGEPNGKMLSETKAIEPVAA